MSTYHILHQLSGVRFWTLNALDICSSYDVAVIKGNIVGCNPSPNRSEHVNAFLFSANGQGTPANHSAAQIRPLYEHVFIVWGGWITCPSAICLVSSVKC